MLPVRDDNPTRHKPVVTVVVMVLCAVAYLLWQPSPFGRTNADVTFNLRHAAIPLEIRQGDPLTNCQVFTAYSSRVQAAQVCSSTDRDASFASGKQPYLAVLTSLFLHGSLVHLGGNLLFLWIFGNNVEDRLGRVRYIVFYLMAGVVATIAHVMVNASSAETLVGASGAIAGVMGAYLVWFPLVKITTAIFFVIFVRLRAWVLLAVWFVLQFFTNASSNVAWVAHVAGFVFGALVGLLFRGDVHGPQPVLEPVSWPPPPSSTGP